MRRLLKAVSAEVPAITVQGSGRMLVVIDHHAAHIFSWGVKGVANEETLEPHDPHHFHHHLVHRKEAHFQGDRVPEDSSFYEEVSTRLAPAREITLIGHGTGTSNAADVLLAHLKKHHPELARRVVANETADLSALTVPEVEALARRHADTTPAATVPHSVR
jgi:hypothetical protein